MIIETVTQRRPTMVVRLFKEVVVIIEYGEKETNMFSSMKIGIMGLEQESWEGEVFEKSSEVQTEVWLVD